MCVSSDKFTHSLTQFKDLSKFTNSPNIVLYMSSISLQEAHLIFHHKFLWCALPRLKCCPVLRAWGLYDLSVYSQHLAQYLAYMAGLQNVQK